MRSHTSTTDLRALARSYLSFTQKQGERSQSFTEGAKTRQCLTCVNFRDCGQVSPNLREGLIYRSSQVVESSEIRKLQLGAVLDLRVLKKPCKKHADDALQQVKRTESSRIRAVRDGSGTLSPGSGSSDEEATSDTPGLPQTQWTHTCSVCPICTEDFRRQHGVNVPIYHSDLVPWATKLRVFGKLPARTKAKAINEICHLRNPNKMVAAAVVDPDVMGPTVLYKLLLDHSKASIAKALRIFARPDSYPVLVHCIHGKDRTGLVIMLVLLICDVPTKLVVADYIQSELQLKAGRDKGDLRELDDFLTSDNVIASKADTMVETIAHLEESYGSARGYAHAVGLTGEEIASIRTYFMKQADHTDLFDRFSSRQSHEPARAFCARSSMASELSPLSEPNGDLLREGEPLVDEEEAATGLEHAVCGGISDIAIKAANEAVNDQPGGSGLRQRRSDGAISVEKLQKSPREFSSSHLLDL